MTDAQSKRFYFPNWSRACENHDWRMEKGRLRGKRVPHFGPLKPDDINSLYQAVWNAAAARAAGEHRAVTPDDLRHACHAVALGRDKSHMVFSNKETDHVVALFKILADPDDLDAVLGYLHPENSEHDRLVWSIQHSGAPDAWIQGIADRTYAGADWQSLDNIDLRNLLRILRESKRAWNRTDLTAKNAEKELEADPF